MKTCDMWRTPGIVAYGESLGCKVQVQPPEQQRKIAKVASEAVKYFFTIIKCNFLGFKLLEGDFVWKILSA